jgi:nucleoid-associated protein YgaU
LTNRARLILALIWLVLIGAGAVAFVYPWPGPESADVTMTVNVDVGDTLWDIAGEVAPAVDRRETVATIMDLNDLSSPRDIRVGDELLVPTRYAPQ